MYHSGATDDLGAVIDYFLSADKYDYQEIALVGFSLGGNLVLKYLGEQGNRVDSRLIASVTFSVPTNLHAGSLNIGKKTNYIYEKKFLDSLTEKMKLKHEQYPDDITLELLKDIKTLMDFDDKITGPIHGFQDAIDYYTQCSSEHFIPDIKIDSLIINALDDPFLPEACYPYLLAKKNPSVQFLAPKYGGHVGFTLRGHKHYWAEKVIAGYLNEKSEIST